MTNWTSIITAASHGLTTKGLEYTIGVATSPPSRNPSNASGANLIVDFASRKMGHTVPVESLTVEAAYVQMLEIKIPCLGYWPQPLHRPILCTCRDGIKRTLWLTFDFLVVYGTHVELVECKTEAEAVKLSLEFPGRYCRDAEGNWTGPEIEEALKEYGIRFRVVTTAELPSTLLRNYTLLEEARQDEYSSPRALDCILRCFPKNDKGVALSELLEKAGADFTKNDVYYAILRDDLHVLLDECLLVDDRTTIVFSIAYHAEVHRMLFFQTKARSSAPVVLKQGSRLRWNGGDYSVCNASPESVYIIQKDGHPLCMPRALLQSLMRGGEIHLWDEESVSLGALHADLKRHLKVLTPGNQTMAINRKRFLDFRKDHSDARAEDFGLEPVSERTVIRWANLARKSESKYGNPYWLLLNQPRDGRPRDVLPSEMRDEMTAIAKELYFQQVGRSLRYVWRELRRRRQARGVHIPSIGAFREHVSKMKNLKEATSSREGDKSGYKFGNSDLGEPNWITPGDFPFKVTQMDGKTLDIEVVDDETGEPLGKPTITLRVLPHYGAVPVGWAMLFEPESNRSASMAYRDQMERFNEASKFEIVDNGKAFNNCTYDGLLGTLDTTKINRKPYDPRFASEIESVFNTMDREVIHNLEGNTKATQDAKNMDADMDPKKKAVWTFRTLYDRLEYYLFTLLWDAPSSSLGMTPRAAFERDLRRAPDRAGRFMLSPEQAQIAFMPEVDGGTRVVQPGRGVYVEGYYYWHDAMKRPGVEKTEVLVRYDPFDLYTCMVAIDGKWEECTARRAPELRNVTEKTRRMMCVVRRRHKNTHAKRRENTHGKRLAEMANEMRADEKVQLQLRRDRAQQHATGKGSSSESNNGDKKPVMPKLDFKHLRKAA
ncbi:MAG: Mu transposase C-terminal domain-containing protein [Opitutae bacterium]|nr:Mu transposase C-terminal domain-containing protein [Opitutae bacterium]